MPDGSQWDGLDSYFVLHGMTGADALAHTRNCSLSELHHHYIPGAPLVRPLYWSGKCCLSQKLCTGATCGHCRQEPLASL